MKPWIKPMLVGAALRLIAAVDGYGFFASDDYRYALEPAYKQVIDGFTRPASEIRSVVFARLLASVMHVCHALGVSDPTCLVRGVYVALGLFSLLAIPGVYRLTKATYGAQADDGGKPAALVAAWLMACEALMPRLSTRALIEVAAIPALVWGMALAAEAVTSRRALLAGVLLGVAAMLRFQVGLVAACVVLIMVVQRRPWIALATTCGGLVALLTQGLIDLASHGRFLATLTSYIAFNAERSSSFGTAPWFTYVVMLLLLTLPPLTLWLAQPLWRAARKAPFISVPLAVFVIVHSLIPHKEERFIFSVLPLVFVLLAAALTEVRRSIILSFWALNTVGLVVATLSDGQRNIIDPLVGTPVNAELAIVGGYEVPQLYAGSRALVRYTDNAHLVAAWTASPPGALTRVVVSVDRLPIALPVPGVTCSPPVIYEGDLVDRFLVWVNPKGNGRRSAKAAIDCAP